MNWLLAQASSFAEEYCTGSFPTTLSGRPAVAEKLCTVGDLINLSYRALHFAVMVFAPAVVAIMAVYGAILVTLYGMNPSNLQKGKKIIFDAVIGLIIVWSAWTIVNTFFYILGVTLPCGGAWYTISTCSS